MSFDRIVELTVQTTGAEAIDLTGLRIRFNVLKTSQSESNEVAIEIYNLSRETFDKISAVDNIVILKAGYVDEGGAKMVATGNIVRAVYMHQGSETVAVITCLDGQKEARAIPVSLSYATATQVSTVVNDILSKIPMAIGKKAAIPRNEYTIGYSFLGKAFDALAGVLSRVGLAYAIQNNQIYILASGETIEPTAILISPETGLLESPVPKASANGAGGTAIESKIYKVRCLLNPLLLPGSYIQLKSRNLTGFFKVQVIRQKGDSWKGAYESDMEVIQL